MFRAKLLNYFRSRDRGWVISLLVAGCLLYLPFLGSPFFFDDLGFFFNGVAKRYGHSLFQFDMRWLPFASLGWTELAFSNVVTHFFHLGNLLLHLGNTILLFYFLRQLTAAAAPNAPSVDRGAWLGALIFALHPVAVYAVGYVVQRSILMAVFFSLALALSYMRGLLTGRVRWFALAVVAYFLAVFSKEHSVMMPAILAALTVLLRPQVKASPRALWSAWAAFLAIGVFTMLRARGVFGTPYEAMAADLFKQDGIVEGGAVLHLLSVFTQAGLFFKYLLLWLIPNPAWMSIDMREPFVSSLSAWQGWLGAAAFIAYGAFAVRLLMRRGVSGLAGFALLYPWLLFVLEFSSIRIQEPFVLYRSYLWMPGLLLFVPLLLARWPARRTVLLVGVAVVLLAPAAANRLWSFADGYRLWDDAARLLPNERVAGADRIYFNRGQAAESRGNLNAAIADFQRSLAISPKYAPVHFELGWAYGGAARLDEAMAEFNETIRLDPNFGNAYYGKALLMKIRHDNEQAAALMAKACELKNAMACLIVKGHIDHSGEPDY